MIFYRSFQFIWIPILLGTDSRADCQRHEVSLKLRMILKGKKRENKKSYHCRQHMACSFNRHTIGFGWYLIAFVATLSAF